MKNPRVPIALEGLPFIFFSGFATLVLAILSWDLLALCMLAFSGLVLYFFRDPERMAPDDADALVAPADGKVILIEKVFDELFIKEHAYKLSIFMNVFNVHVNRVPCGGRVLSTHYVSGRFLAADSERAALENEHCALVLETPEKRKLAVVQVAGLVARRIVCWATRGDTLERAERFGLIRFGSRVDLYLPVTVQLEVAVGQKVRAGETVLGYFSVK